MANCLAVSDGYLVEQLTHGEVAFTKVCDALGLSQLDLDTIIVTFIRRGLTSESRNEKLTRAQHELSAFADSVAARDEIPLWEGQI